MHFFLPPGSHDYVRKNKRRFPPPAIHTIALPSSELLHTHGHHRSITPGLQTTSWLLLLLQSRCNRARLRTGHSHEDRHRPKRIREKQRFLKTHFGIKSATKSIKNHSFHTKKSQTKKSHLIPKMVMVLKSTCFVLPGSLVLTQRQKRHHSNLSSPETNTRITVRRARCAVINCGCPGRMHKWYDGSIDLGQRSVGVARHTSKSIKKYSEVSNRTQKYQMGNKSMKQKTQV